jgi:hypothetical protein
MSQRQHDKLYLCYEHARSDFVAMEAAVAKYFRMIASEPAFID